MQLSSKQQCLWGKSCSATMQLCYLQSKIPSEGMSTRLIGTVYFKKHASGFGTYSPAAHFQKFTDPTLTVREQHSAWLEDIRQNISYRIKFENEMVPSDEALKLHWKRSCWVIHMWKQSDQNRMVLEPINLWMDLDRRCTYISLGHH